MLEYWSVILLAGGMAAIDTARGQDAPAPTSSVSASSPAHSHAPTVRGGLAPGDLAPDLFISQWVRGGPITPFATGSVSAVVFWATWCDASVSAIPALNSIQREFADRGLRVAAISSRDSEGESLPRLKVLAANSMPPIEFSVAFDDHRRTAHAWLDAAEQEYIPTVFLVDRSGRIAWIGSPLWPPGEFHDAVSATLAGELDAPRRERLHAKWSNLVTRMQELESEAQRAEVSGRIDEASRLFDELIALNARAAPKYAIGKFSMLLSPGREEKAYEFARGAIAGPLRESPALLNELAWAILDDPGLEARDFKLALAAARRAEELTQGRDAAILDTAARAFQCLGDLGQAVEFQARAVEAAQSDSDRDEYAERLAEYQRARQHEKR